MQDRIPVNPGRVLVTPENGNAPYYATLTRADNPTQAGTPLNKATLLKDATAAKFGLGADAVPDDAFGLLSRFQSGLGNEYVWAKQASGLVDVVVKSSTTSVIDLGADNVVDAYAVASVVDGNIVLSYKVSNIYPYNNAVGYYAYYNGNPYYLSAFESSGPNSIKFSANLLTVGQETVQGVVGYVNSPNPNAYPPVVDDGFTYTALGRLGAKVQIATGSYVGTGTYGADNPNTLTFDFAPKSLFLFAEVTSGAKVMYGIGSGANADNSAYIWGIPCRTGESYNVSYYSGKYNTVTVSADGKTISWVAGYNVDSGGQFNVSGWTYHYIAIG